MAFRVRNSDNNKSNNIDLDLEYFKEELNNFVEKNPINKEINLFTPKEIGKTYKLENDIDKKLNKDLNKDSENLYLIDCIHKYEKDIIVYDIKESSWKIVKQSELYKYDLV
jgi:hypothetical protein